MATEVVSSIEVMLEDDTKVTVKPLVIKDLRKFMKVWNDWIEEVQNVMRKRLENEIAKDNGDDEPHQDVPSITDTADEEYEKYADLLEICLRKPLRKADWSDEYYREYIEDNVNTVVMKKVLKVAGNLDLKDEDENGEEAGDLV